MRQHEGPDLWHNKLASGLLEGTFFTDGSSAESGALRRAGWALVTTTADSKLISTTCGPGASRLAALHDFASWRGLRSEDNSPPTPVTLHIDCAGTVGAVMSPRKKTLGSGGAGLWQPMRTWWRDTMTSTVRPKRARKPRGPKQQRPRPRSPQLPWKDGVATASRARNEPVDPRSFERHTL